MEALDKNGRPLCLLSENDIVSQNLPHKRFAAVAVAPGGLILAAERQGPLFDVTASGAVEAGLTAEESAENAILHSTGHCGQLKQIKKSPAGLTIFCALFSRAMLQAICPPVFAILNLAEIAELSRQEIISPLLLSIVPGLGQVCGYCPTRACPQAVSQIQNG